MDALRFGVRRLDGALFASGPAMIESGVKPPHSKI
jgi:hypothetical protein